MFDQRMRHRAITDESPVVFQRATHKELGRVGNISSDGILLLCDEELGLHQILELEMALPRGIHGRSTVAFNAQVMWVQPVNNTGLTGCGLAYRRVSDEDMEIFEELIKDFVF